MQLNLFNEIPYGRDDLKTARSEYDDIKREYDKQYATGDAVHPEIERLFIKALHALIKAERNHFGDLAK